MFNFNQVPVDFYGDQEEEMTAATTPAVVPPTAPPAVVPPTTEMPVILTEAQVTAHPATVEFSKAPEQVQRAIKAHCEKNIGLTFGQTMLKLTCRFITGWTKVGAGNKVVAAKDTIMFIGFCGVVYKVAVSILKR